MSASYADASKPVEARVQLVIDEGTAPVWAQVLCRDVAVAFSNRACRYDAVAAEVHEQRRRLIDQRAEIEAFAQHHKHDMQEIGRLSHELRVATAELTSLKLRHAELRKAVESGEVSPGQGLWRHR